MHHLMVLYDFIFNDSIREVVESLEVFKVRFDKALAGMI